MPFETCRWVIVDAARRLQLTDEQTRELLSAMERASIDYAVEESAKARTRVVPRIASYLKETALGWGA